MSDLQNLGDALYSRFLLRDVFGKVVPGTIVLLAFTQGLDSTQEIVKWLSDPPILAWPVLYGAAWITGVTVQHVPECLGFSHTYDKRRHPDGRHSFYEGLNEALAVAQPSEAQQIERFVVLKEATGNTCWAILVAPLVWWLNALAPFRSVISHWPVIVTWAVVAALLHSMHRSQLENQEEYLAAVRKRAAARAP